VSVKVTVTAVSDSEEETVTPPSPALAGTLTVLSAQQGTFTLSAQQGELVKGEGYLTYPNLY
jgi:hypothetical protein